MSERTSAAIHDRPDGVARLFTVLLATGCLLGSIGCLSSRPALSPRYFVVPPTPIVAPSIAANAPEVRIGRVTAAAHLRDRLAWRLSDVELAFDEESRWAVAPEEMLREAIERACYASGGVRESKERGIPQLDVHLENFEGRTESGDALISIRLRWRDESARALASRIVRLELPLEEVSAESLARTLGRALETASVEVVEWVVARATGALSP